MKLKDIQQYTKVKIPKSDLVITLKHHLPWYDQMELANIQDNTEKAKFLIWKLISDWNLCNDDGEKVPITKEIVDEFGAGIIFPLEKEIAKIKDIQVQKKKI